MGKPLLAEEPAQAPREAGPQLGGPYLLLHQGLLLSQAGAHMRKGGCLHAPGRGLLLRKRKERQE